MKNYFEFTLTGRKLFLTYFIYLIVCFGAIVWIQISAAKVNMQYAMDHSALINYYLNLGLIILFLSLVIPTLYFFLVKLFFQGIVYNGEALQCAFPFGHYLGLAIGGTLLSIITIGIYYPWFLTRLLRFFSRYTTYRGEPFAFNGKGLTLLGIMVLSLVLPIFLFTVVMVVAMSAMATGGSPAAYGLLIGVVLCAFLICIIALKYLTYKWMMDFSYKSFLIGWNTTTSHAVGFLLGQFLLCCITLGFYIPAAIIRIYRYFANRTEASENGVPSKLWGYDAQIRRDYWYFLGQYLLTAITIGIYGAWATTKITRRLVCNTYLKSANEE